MRLERPDISTNTPDKKNHHQNDATRNTVAVPLMKEFGFCRPMVAAEMGVIDCGLPIIRPLRRHRETFGSSSPPCEIPTVFLTT